MCRGFRIIFDNTLLSGVVYIFWSGVSQIAAYTQREYQQYRYGLKCFYIENTFIFNFTIFYSCINKYMQNIANAKNVFCLYSEYIYCATNIYKNVFLVASNNISWSYFRAHYKMFFCAQYSMLI